MLRVGEGDGEGEVRGEGNGPTPMVNGSMGSVVLPVPPPEDPPLGDSSTHFFILDRYRKST